MNRRPIPTYIATYTYFLKTKIIQRSQSVNNARELLGYNVPNYLLFFLLNIVNRDRPYRVGIIMFVNHAMFR